MRNGALVAHWTGIFARPPLACMLWMSDQGSLDIEAHRLAFQFPLSSDAGVSETSKAPIRQMPAFLFPARLRFADLSLHRLLSTRQGLLGVHDHPAFWASSSSRLNQWTVPSSD
jgi:hypothetical protein